MLLSICVSQLGGNIVQVNLRFIPHFVTDIVSCKQYYVSRNNITYPESDTTFLKCAL